MLRITIELVPFGIGLPKRIAMMEVFNDGTGTKRLGNYGFRLYNKAGNIYKRGKVKGYKRLDWGVWRLLYMILKETCGGKKDTDNL